MSAPLEYPHGRIAQTVERKAGERFGPEKLTKETVSQALNFPADELTDEEWAEISEFSVNAGAALIRSAIQKDVPSAVASGNIEEVRERIKENKDGLIPFHDIFHAAETYRLTEGRSASAEFVETDIRSRYANPASAVAELYPVLFLIFPPELNSPLPVLLSSYAGRKQVAKFLSKLLDTSLPGVQETIARLDEPNMPETPTERQKEYELLVELIVVSNAIRRLRDMEPSVAPLTTAERDAIHDALEKASQNPTPHYKQFAERVFEQTDWSKEPRLFLDEFLESIRKTPPLHKR